MKKPTQPCQPPTVCLLGFAHKCEQHHQLHDLAVMPRPIRREVTLLFLFPPLPPLGRGTTPVSEHHPPPTRRARRQGAAEPRHPARGSPAGGSPAQPGPAQPSQGRLSGWMSTWVISAKDSTHSRGLTAGRGHRVAAVLRSSAKSPWVEEGGK